MHPSPARCPAPVQDRSTSDLAARRNPFSVRSSRFFVERYLFPLHYLQGNVHHVSGDIIVGPYPDEGLLDNLHHRGVRIVVSLLDPRLIYEKSDRGRDVRYRTPPAQIPASPI